ncbi:hypothetical protein NIASO_10745 [Niabella soli DSM 19437]|uniref:Uncharacterized protein n=1 Tax=Niabella soli DSM 19437 TaxID=929713 RepID=W0F3J9_9BACT|nr:hypothetical protein NIASO_10745 [Niabella soli DSM 19437]
MLHLAFPLILSRSNTPLISADRFSADISVKNRRYLREMQRTLKV